jgi:biopolymer transport protein ExbB/TolQ
MSGVFVQWAAISAVIGVIGLIIVVMTHIVKYAVQHGATQERLKRIESEIREQRGVADSVMELRTSVGILQSTVHELREFVKEINNRNREKSNNDRYGSGGGSSHRG